MKINQIDEFTYEIPQDFFPKMKVPARFYSNDSQIKQLTKDGSLNQLVNVATLPGIVNYSLAMPDIHQGYGFPIGGVAAFDIENGIISPGGVGYDINCGIRVITTNLHNRSISPLLPQIIKDIYNKIPLGTGKGSLLSLTKKQFSELVTKGVEWTVDNGYSDKDDLSAIEDNGSLPVEDISQISDLAWKRGLEEIGSLGSGNHFIEMAYVDKIFDNHLAQKFNLFKNEIVIWIHTGSRGFGHQICSDFVVKFQKVAKDYGIELVDRGLACAPFDSKEGQSYFQAMNSAANFAFVNRQIISWKIREIFNSYQKKLPPINFQLLYDVAHNIAKIETYKIGNRKRTLIVHRKGATRAFTTNIPSKYFETGQPVLVPGSMGSFSYILAALPKAEQEAFGSCCHGAGRRMSRSQAKKSINSKELKKDLENRGIIIQTLSLSSLSEEAPEAYKNVKEVVEIVSNVGLAKLVARTKPIGVIKG
ncbi:MAG: RtcB family protein [Candidatus Kapaibacteriales bacterium]